MNRVLIEFPHEIAAREERELLEKFLNTLPVNKDNFGLIHYDFEADNVFYDDESDTFTPIDFDDAVYHWFIMDIEQSLDSMKEDMPTDRHERAVKKWRNEPGWMVNLRKYLQEIMIKRSRHFGEPIS